jgi:hypothetical protein
MNSDYVGVFHEQGIAHVLDGVHGIDRVAVKVNRGEPDQQHIQEEKGRIFRRKHLHVEQKSTTLPGSANSL